MIYAAMLPVNDSEGAERRAEANEESMILARITARYLGEKVKRWKRFMDDIRWGKGV